MQEGWSPPTTTTQVKGGEVIVEVKTPKTWSRTDIESARGGGGELKSLECGIQYCDTKRVIEDR